MVSFGTFNPTCYLPSSVVQYIPSAVACPPPPSAARTIYATVFSPVTSTYTTLRTGMDALMSLPFLSFLLIPTMTSYSTSLNLLFFYLTWSTLVLSHTPLRVEIVASLGVRILFYIFPSLVFLLFDMFIPSLSESMKSAGVDALPFTDTSRKNVLKNVRVLGWSVFNVALSVFAQALTEWFLVVQLGRPSALKVTTTLPLPWAIVKDLLRGLLVRDALTWLVHRYVLHPERPPNALFRDLAGLHQTWYHRAVRIPFPLSSSYDHPLIYILRSFLPMYLPAMYWRFHALTYILYMILLSLEDTFTHSGYAKLPTNFVLGGIAHRNEAHCFTEGRGNFGTWGLCDWLMGTSIGRDATEDLVDEMDEAEVKETTSARATKGRSRGKKPAGRRNGSAGEVAQTRRRSRRARVDSDYEE